MDMTLLRCRREARDFYAILSLRLARWRHYCRRFSLLHQCRHHDSAYASAGHATAALEVTAECGKLHFRHITFHIYFRGAIFLSGLTATPSDGLAIQGFLSDAIVFSFLQELSLKMPWLRFIYASASSRDKHHFRHAARDEHFFMGRNHTAEIFRQQNCHRPNGNLLSTIDITTSQSVELLPPSLYASALYY